MPPKLARIKRARVVNRELAKLFPESLQTPLNHNTDWELLVAVILSAQCTDEVVNKVTKKLFTRYKTLDDYVHAKPQEFRKMIRSTGFYNAKAKSILSTAKILHKTYKGKIPKTMPELLELPGVGRKTANIILGHIHNHVEGIAVDTHVRRLARKFKLTTNTDPNKIEQDLMKLLPQKDWWNFSYRLKAYGRKYSPARLNNIYSDPISKALSKIHLL